jgi:hypothetical protein
LPPNKQKAHMPPLNTSQKYLITPQLTLTPQSAITPVICASTYTATHPTYMMPTLEAEQVVPSFLVPRLAISPNIPAQTAIRPHTTVPFTISVPSWSMSWHQQHKLNVVPYSTTPVTLFPYAPLSLKWGIHNRLPIFKQTTHVP